MYRCLHETMLTNIRGPATGACPGSMYEGVDAMGRGRQKAKQTKVARQLKYFSPNTDYTALQRELAGSPDHADGHVAPADDAFDQDDEFDESDLDDDADDDGDADDEYAGWSAGGSR